MYSFFLLLLNVLVFHETMGTIPIVINTWDFEEATNEAWNALVKGRSAIEAVETGCSACERLQCDGTVGFGGSPDENGETTLDALIFDGTTMDMGAVGALRNVKSAISVARHVLQYTTHSLLVGMLATNFAVEMGFTSESLSTNRSLDIWRQWKQSECQPNCWQNVSPNSKKHCGPYKPTSKKQFRYGAYANEKNHDTIGMVAIDGQGNVVAGTSTNGMTHKIPGRVGDSPIPGAGAYADSTVGGASGTGDGDVMMRFLPSFVAVEEMRNGASPTKAARTAIRRIKDKYPTFFGGLVAVDKNGTYGAACNGMEKFTFCIANADTNKAKRVKITCT